MQSGEIGKIIQHGYVVEDVEQAALNWVERTGAGPFFVFDRVEFGDYALRGQKATMALRIALGFWADLQIELIQPLEAEGVFAEALRQAPGQINHYGVFTEDLDGLLERHALKDRILHEGAMPGLLDFVYLDGYVPGGLHLEIVQPTPAFLEGFRAMEQAARGWDGQDPIRKVAGASR